LVVVVVVVVVVGRIQNTAQLCSDPLLIPTPADARTCDGRFSITHSTATLRPYIT
jgi:hypothetical protein